MKATSHSSDPSVGRPDAADHFRKVTELLLDFAYAVRVEPSGQLPEWQEEDFARVGDVRWIESHVRPEWDPAEGG